MALVGDNYIFLHVPKTGGHWVRHALACAGLPGVEVGSHHIYLHELYNQEGADLFKGRLVFAFVRHPLSWYQSIWSFRMKQGWSMRHPLDYNCASNHFDTFVNNCLTRYPEGWLTHVYHNYLETIPNAIGFIGKQENLLMDFLRVLQLLHNSVDQAGLYQERVNDSNIQGRTSSELALYEPQTRERVLQTESIIIDKYYPNNLL